MPVLGIDTSNYATSLAVVSATGEVVCAEKRFLPVKQGALGLRQSDALFHHTVALPEMLEAMGQEGALRDITAVGVAATPRGQQGSYMPCFLAGVSAGAAFAAALGAPLVRTSHQQGHIAAARFGTGNPQLLGGRALVFHVSGGTTELLLANGNRVEQKLGGSLDLYAGQAVDRLGVKLGFPFPAGPQLSALAAECGEEMAPKVSVKGMDCHLSGLQNQCEALLAAGKSPAYAARYCLEAIAATLQAMLNEARRQYPGLPVVLAGGVVSSGIIRRRMEQNSQNIYFVPPQLSADNAVGVALIAREETNG